MIEWTREQLRSVLEESFKEFDTRSFGLLVLSSYCLAQPVYSLRSLTWGDTNLEEKKVKSGGINLPVSDYLEGYLREQKELWDFQPYVFPYLRKSDNAYRPIPNQLILKQFNAIKKTLGAPSGLRLENLHKLRLKELVNEGVDPLHILTLMGTTERKRLLKYLEDFEGIANKILTESNQKCNSNLNLKPGDRRLSLMPTENQSN
jgi:hypothetical protein